MTSTPPGAMVVHEPAGELGHVERSASQNPAYRYLRAEIRTASGRRAMTQMLKDVARLLGEKLTGAPWTIDTCEWARIDYDALLWLRTALVESTNKFTGEPLKPSTVNLHIAAVKGVMRQAYLLKMIDADQYTRLKEVRGARGRRLRPGRALSRRELQTLAGACDPNTPMGARALALVHLLGTLGLRGVDACNLDLADWSPGPAHLRVRGKGGHERLAHPRRAARAALESWIAVRGDFPGPLFVALSPHGTIPSRRRRGDDGRLSVPGLCAAIKRLATAANVQRFSPHDLRRTMIGNMFDAKEDPAIIMRTAGHASLDTTVLYDRRPEQRVADAADRFARWMEKGGR